MNLTTDQLLRQITQTLSTAGVENADLEARFLMQSALKTDHTGLLRVARDSIDSAAADALQEMVQRRLEHIPLAHILGTSEFYGREFFSSPEALVPRKETEQLVEEALKRLPAQGLVLDLACGSGCIGITIALERTDLRVHLTDVSREALSLARKNAAKLHAEVDFFEGSWFDAVPLHARYAAILTNPPYIFRDEAEYLSPEVLKDPDIALFHDDPVALYEFLLREGEDRLAPGGFFLAETSARVARGFQDRVQILKDFAGHDRMLLKRVD